MKRFAIAWTAIVVIILILAYLVTGFHFPNINLFPGTTTTVQPNATIPTTTIGYIVPCSNLYMQESLPNSTNAIYCSSNGNTIGLWVAAGQYASENVKIVGKDNITYVNQTAKYSCLTFYDNYTLPIQDYTVFLTTGKKISSSQCQKAVAQMNSSTTPPINKVYQFVYNGNFSNGAYTGWNVTGKGFGTAPLNITYANQNNCYINKPFTNYNGTYAASTYHCGTSVTFGNLTSSPFLVTAAYLNFKVISSENNGLYIEILSSSNKPITTVHYSTYNLSQANSTPSKFMNASIPLFGLYGSAVKVRIVSATLSQQRFIAATNFMMSNTPEQDPGIVVNMSTTK
ncbi:MAG: hypothetical protein M1500_01835 [Candidatus Marsarchaeota archaeon]|jgi:hypothetical protein|nr:hypothetical protein [Candidatus Marsarchaeota archaeon]